MVSDEMRKNVSERYDGIEKWLWRSSFGSDLRIGHRVYRM